MRRTRSRLRPGTAVLIGAAVMIGLGGVGHAASYKNICTFDSIPQDGDQPSGGLLDLDGLFYGTTTYGGEKGAGTVFSLTPAGTETSLYSFTSNGDGAGPTGGLVYFDGTLYGTTASGGEHNLGAVFAITPQGSERVIYSFQGGDDGQEPLAGLIVLNGTLYGTTFEGGPNNDGTVFSVTTGGQEGVVHAFTGGDDGSRPAAALTAYGGTLYGTTEYGGTPGLDGFSWGTVFAVTPAGAETVVHSFYGGYDGEFPLSPLTASDGELFGTTSGGGLDAFGTVFTLSLAGKHQIIYNFGTNPGDGQEPAGNLLIVGGTIYGTTASGGDRNLGTLYSVTLTGQEQVFDLPAGIFARTPSSGFLDLDGTLYAESSAGGSLSDKGHGTVFAIFESPAGAQSR